MTTYTQRLTTQTTGSLRNLKSMTFSHLLDNLMLWQRRHSERRYLLTLDERMLRDIGLSRADIAQETGKRFWQS